VFGYFRDALLFTDLDTFDSIIVVVDGDCGEVGGRGREKHDSESAHRERRDRERESGQSRGRGRGGWLVQAQGSTTPPSPLNGLLRTDYILSCVDSPLPFSLCTETCVQSQLRIVHNNI